MTQNKKRLISFTPNIDNKMLEIQEYLGVKSMTAAVEYCVNFTHAKELNNYVQVTKRKESRATMSPDEAVLRNAQKYQDRKDANNALSIARGIKICEALEGTVNVDPSGNTLCTWSVYQKETPHYVSVGTFTKAAQEMTDDLLESQYRGGTRQEIISILEKTDK